MTILFTQKYRLYPPTIKILCKEPLFSQEFTAQPVLDILCHPPCPDGETWDEECQECICESICDGTIASIIRSIVL